MSVSGTIEAAAGQEAVMNGRLMSQQPASKFRAWTFMCAVTVILALIISLATQHVMDLRCGGAGICSYCITSMEREHAVGWPATLCPWPEGVRSGERFWS